MLRRAEVVLGALIGTLLVLSGVVAVISSFIVQRFLIGVGFLIGGWFFLGRFVSPS